MPKTLSLLTAAALLALAAPLSAQDAGTGQAEAPAGQPDEALDLGQDVTNENGVGSTYIAEEHGDWAIQCVRTEQPETDPCRLYQLLNDSEGNAVAEVRFFPVPEGGQAVAGATVVVPLETLLTQQLTIQVDDGNAKRYAFSYCNAVGCVARVGFTEADINAFRRGAVANVSIVPAAAPDQRVNLEMSLTGFTAGFEAVSDQ
mgnify:CR=1 FL=1